MKRLIIERGQKKLKRGPKAVIKEMSKYYVKWRGFDDPSDINWGDCAYFAKLVKKVLPTAKLFYDGKRREPQDYFTHCYLQYKGKYYDSEVPHGISDWNDLPTYIRERSAY